MQIVCARYKRIFLSYYIFYFRFSFFRQPKNQPTTTKHAKEWILCTCSVMRCSFIPIPVCLLSSRNMSLFRPSFKSRLFALTMMMTWVICKTLAYNSNPYIRSRQDSLRFCHCRQSVTPLPPTPRFRIPSSRTLLFFPTKNATKVSICLTTYCGVRSVRHFYCTRWSYRFPLLLLCAPGYISLSKPKIF